jgi:hypothetical protein
VIDVDNSCVSAVLPSEVAVWHRHDTGYASIARQHGDLLRFVLLVPKRMATSAGAMQPDVPLVGDLANDHSMDIQRAGYNAPRRPAPHAANHIVLHVFGPAAAKLAR